MKKSWKSNRRIFIIFAVLLVLEIIFLNYPLNYLVYFGGQATDLTPFIEVVDVPSDDQGAFYMLSVHTTKANGALWLRSLVNKNMDLVPVANRIPQGMSMEEYNQLMLDMMDESQKKATLMALQLGGFDYEIEGGGILVEDFTEQSLLKEVLQKGDIIKSLDGHRVLINEDLQGLLQTYQPSDQIELVIEREGETLTLKGALISDEQNNAKLGIYVSSTPFELQHQFEINFDDQQIGGGSAGMMLTLQILDKLLPEDLSAGYKIAGTGTIRLDGSIGPIEGLTQKIKAAEDEGAPYLLVAADNAEEAKLYAKEIEVIPIANLQEALEFLQGLEPN